MDLKERVREVFELMLQCLKQVTVSKRLMLLLLH